MGVSWNEEKIRLFIVLLIGVMIISACGGSDGDKKRITVGSKHFTETFILAEMMAYLLEDNGFEVDRVIPLGGHFWCNHNRCIRC
jgi:osmoprotectant transport system substrate-binding protein